MYRVQIPMLILASLVIPTDVTAQITTDASVGTTVTPNQLINNILSDRIDGGTIRGNNLFHSFQEFNINAGRGVYFTNPTDVINIFTRVTGANPSNINGRLGVLGQANLFFINPNGIIFGSNASLDIKGSFFSTTASNINFADGTQYNASNSQSNPVLTLSVPVGLGFGSNPGAITVQGSGHNLRGGLAAPLTGNRGVSQLSINPGNTLALVGGTVTLDGGVITGEGANIEIGSVGNQNQNGIVRLQPTSTAWTFDYTGINNFAYLDLKQRALVDASGINPGTIQFRGKDINISAGSLVLIENRGTGSSGNITANASDNFNINGATSNNSIDSRLMTYTTGSGKAADISISAKQLILEQGGDIAAQNYSSRGQGGNVKIDVSELIKIGDADVNSQSTSTIASQISASTYGSGNGGNLIISTKQINMFPRAAIATGTISSTGLGGNITINATESMNMQGVAESPNVILVSSSSLGAGKAGDVEINTSKLRLSDGAAIGASNFGTGSGGKITVNASESIELSGSRADLSSGSVPSQIAASSRSANPNTRRSLNLPSIPEGNSGSVTLNSPLIQVTNKAEIAVRNEGRGSGGILTINTGRLLLDNQSQLQGTSSSGTGGDISVKADNLLLTNSSNISSFATSNGNGGNINLDVGAIALLSASKINANAVQGRGGNITISTQGLFQSSDSAITASGTVSNGEIRVFTPDINQENTLLQQTSNFVNTDKVVASSCLPSRNTEQGRFVVTGNGGLPETPKDDFVLPYKIIEIQAVNSSSSNTSTNHNSTSNSQTNWQIGDPIIEATQLVKTPDGRLLLQAVTTASDINSTNSTCNI